MTSSSDILGFGLARTADNVIERFLKKRRRSEMPGKGACTDDKFYASAFILKEPNTTVHFST